MEFLMIPRSIDWSADRRLQPNPNKMFRHIHRWHTRDRILLPLQLLLKIKMFRGVRKLISNDYKSTNAEPYIYFWWRINVNNHTMMATIDTVFLMRLTSGAWKVWQRRPFVVFWTVALAGTERRPAIESSNSVYVSFQYRYACIWSEIAVT